MEPTSVPPADVTAEAIRQVLGDAGCALCRVRANAARQTFRQLMRGIPASDESSPNRLCPRHAVLLFGPGDLRWRAAFCARAAQDELRVVARLGEYRAPGRRPTVTINRLATCLPCQRERAAEVHAIRILIEGLGSGDLRAAWERSAGLCRPHFRTAWQRGGGVRPLLAAVQRAGLEKLVANLRAWVDEAGGGQPAADVAWHRAVEQLHGLWP